MNPQNFFRVNKLIFAALLIGMLLFLGVTIFLDNGQLSFYIDFEDPFFLIVPAIFVPCIAMSNILPKKFLTQAKTADNLTKKTNIYNTASILKYALIEAPVLIATVGFLLTHSLYFVAMALIGILYFITLKPSEEKISRALDLTYDERAELGFK